MSGIWKRHLLRKILGHVSTEEVLIWKSRDRVREAPAENGYGLLFRHERDGGRRVIRWIHDLQESGLLIPA